MDTAIKIILQTEHLHLLSKELAWHYRLLPKGNAANRILTMRYNLKKAKIKKRKARLIIDCCNAM